MRRLRDQRGQASLELAGSLLLVLFCALAVWQVLIVMWTFNQTSNAARTAARVQTRDGDTRKAARNALPVVLRKGLKIQTGDGQATVHVRIPLFLPGLYSDKVRATRTATLPS